MSEPSIDGAVRPNLLVACVGTATEVGKTWVGAQVVESLRHRSIDVAARKPAESFAGHGHDPLDSTVLAFLAGFSSFTRRAGDTETEQFGGLGALGAGGFDLFRRRGLAVSAEGATTLALYRGGSTVIGVSLQLGVSWY